MLKNTLYARVLACAAGVMLVMPAMPVSAAPKTTQQVRQGLDVVLKGNTLQGKLLSANGKPVAGAAVAVTKNGKLVAKTITKTDGSYTVPGLTSGTHTVTLGEGQFPVRLWSKEVAPASAMAQLTVSQTAVRGQFVDECGCLIWGNAAIGAVALAALTVGIINVVKLDHIDDKLDDICSP